MEPLVKLQAGNVAQRPAGNRADDTKHRSAAQPYSAALSRNVTAVTNRRFGDYKIAFFLKFELG
jgi:hypothetical protein